MTDLKATALVDWHIEQGAKMVPFAGYNMPVQYKTGVIKEHLHTRESAGLFDVSHMGQVRISGENATAILESIFPADLQNLAVNKQTYTFLLNAQGGIVDDLMICRREADYLLVLNAGCKDKDIAYLQQLIGNQLQIEVLTDAALLALQGPKAAEVMTQLGADVSALRFMHGAQLTVAGIDCWVTRSGYTGEDGFEISLANADVKTLVEKLTVIDAVLPAGLGARDSLRLEAGLCLYGHELEEHISPIDAGLNWAIAKNRRVSGAFIASDSLLAQIENGVAKKRMGLIAQGRAPIRENTELFDVNDNVIGVVSSGGFSPSLNKPIAMAYIDKNIAIGDVVFAEVRGKKLPMDVVKMPFVAHQYVK
jgi:aminomethyltransferase